MSLNLVQLQDNLKNLSKDQLEKVYRNGTVPQFLVMTEMARRKEMEAEYQKNQAASLTTVAEDVLSPTRAPTRSATAAKGLGAIGAASEQDGHFFWRSSY